MTYSKFILFYAEDRRPIEDIGLLGLHTAAGYPASSWNVRILHALQEKGMENSKSAAVCGLLLLQNQGQSDFDFGAFAFFAGDGDTVLFSI